MLIVAKIVVWLIGACLQFYIYSLNEKNMAVLLVSFILSMLPMIIKKEFCGEKGIRIMVFY